MALETLQNGRYRILRPLGSGSMGEVYLVEDTRINRQVAIKIIRTEASPYAGSGTNTQTDAARLFEREAKAIARLNHPNILPLFDFGEEVVNGTPLTYMVMPYCAEGSLATWLQQREDSALLQPHEVAHFVKQAADALQHAHDNDIVHQDVKPQNFLIRSNKNATLPDLLLADFGIAKLTAGTSGASQAIRGTPIYMAPEQWEGNPLPASDQYALAIMTYQLLTGRPPFQGGPQQMMFKHLTVNPQPPSTLNPLLNADIDRILLRALAKKPQDRFPSVSAFGDALQRALLTDSPTFLNTQMRPQTDGIRATLAISYAEALNGTSRTLTMANGQRVRVDVPPGIQNGQVLRVEAQDNTIGAGNTTIPLLLTIAISQTADNYPPAYISNDQTASRGNAATFTGERTYLNDGRTMIPPVGGATIGNTPTIRQGSDRPTPVLPPYYDQGGFNNAALPPNIPQNPNAYRGAQPPPKKSNTGLTVLLVILALLLIFGGGGLVFFYFAANNNTANNVNGTATAANGTANAQNNATNTAQANAAATANANAQGSVTAQAGTGLTATAQANETATAQANLNATATAVAVANANATATAQATTPTPTPVPFTAQSVTMTVNPTSISGIACGTNITVTYTATFVVPAHTPGGTIQFTYTTDNGHSQTNGSIAFAAGDTTKTFDFTWSGPLPPDHTRPSTGIVITTSPNAVTSNGAIPSGMCS